MNTIENKLKTFVNDDFHALKSKSTVKTMFKISSKSSKYILKRERESERENIHILLVVPSLLQSWVIKIFYQNNRVLVLFRLGDQDD